VRTVRSRCQEADAIVATASAHVSAHGGDGGEAGQRIFQRFIQLDAGATRQAGGVGLGLYIARQLASGLAGDMLVTDAASPHGDRFEFHLPLLAEAVGS
jgi:signal transduction histidine kinase